MSWLVDFAAAYWHWISIVGFLLAAGIESVRPDRRIRAATLPRWLTHLGTYVACLCFTSAALPVFLVVLFTHRAGDGPERVFAWVHAGGGPWMVLALGLLGIDLAAYWAHWLEHRFQMLWRFHAVHHADPDMDASTTLLHHPVAYLITAGLIGTTMIGLGLPAWVFPVYALFEVAGGVFQHIATPVSDRLERAVRCLFVTPGMHHAHHSDDVAHHNTNFGAVLSVWDRLFGTLLLLDAHERAELRFGIGTVRGTALGRPSSREHGPYGVLTLPFRMRLRGAAGQAAPVSAGLREPGTAQPIHEA